MEQQKNWMRGYLSWRTLLWICGSFVFPYIFAMLIAGVVDVWAGPATPILRRIMGEVPGSLARAWWSFFVFMASMTAMVMLVRWWTALCFSEEKPTK